MTHRSVRLSTGKAHIYAVTGLLVVAALLAGGYAWVTRTSPPQPGTPLERVTIAANTTYAGTCPIFVAQEKSYFASEGVLATIHPYTSGKAALDAVLQGQANLGTVADVPIMFAAMNRQPVSVVATIFTSEKDHGIVGRKDKQVTTPASLKGKRVGVTFGASGHFLLHAFLNRQKLSISDVALRNLAPEELVSALESGDVDAVAAWEPYLSMSAARLGGNAAIFYGEGIYELTFNIAGARDYIASHPETIKKVLRAVVRGGRFCHEAPDAAREIVANAIKTDVATLKALWPSYQFKVSLDQSLLLALEDETRWAINNRLTDRTDMPNYLNYFHLDALRAVTPAAVTVIH
jgi:NitT/TauT family transport system substrate-binding protein